MSAALQSLVQDTCRPEARFEGLVNFIAIGAGGAVAFVALSSAVIWLGTGIDAWVSNAICYALLIVPVYLLQRRYAFGSKASHWQALPRYLAVQGMALLLAALFSYVVHGLMTLPTIFASILVIALTSGVNFVVLRFWAFAARRSALVPASA